MGSRAAKNAVYDLSIVIPAFNEARRIGRTLDELAQYLAQSPDVKDLAVEVVVVAADTTDATHTIVAAKRAKFRALRLLKPGPRVGKGRDVQYGVLRASGRAIIFMDADLATPLQHLGTFFAHHRQGHDVVIATRNLHKHHPNFWRRLVSNGGNLLFRIASGVWVEDSQCGFKLFSHQAAHACFSRLTIMGWGFDMEVLAIAKAQGLSIKTHRVDDWVSVPGSTFNRGMIKNSFVSLRELAYIFWNRLRGVYHGQT